jgi:electron transport complex protein RnfA
VKEIFVILLSTALLVQAVVRRTGPASAKEPKAWFLAGCGVWLVLAVSAALTAALDLLVLQPLGLGAARLIVMLLLIALCALALAKQDICPGLCAPETGGVLLSVAAGAILGLSLIGAEAAAAPAAALKLALILGGLYALLSFLLAGILNRIDEQALPAPVRGIPVLALCAALIAIALMGLNGLPF